MKRTWAFDQQARFDGVVLDLMKDGAIEVDTKNGHIFGRRLDECGKRIQIGYADSYGVKRHTIVVDGRTVVLYAKRTIYLAAVRHRLTGHTVRVIDGDESNVAVANLKIVDTGANRLVRRWSDAERREVVAMVRGGMSYADVAEETGRSYRAVKHVFGGRHPSSGSRKRWTDDDDKKLHNFLCQGKTVREIASLMGRTRPSVYLRVHRVHATQASSGRLKENFDDVNFYSSFRQANRRGTVVSRCCICGYGGAVQLHHIDGDRGNNHVSNMATLCPTHHVEVGNGQHHGEALFAVWCRKYPDGRLTSEHDNKSVVRDSK